VADSLYLSLWFPSFELDEMLPRALAVMRQFPFSAQQPGIDYVALHPVSWNEPTILEQRFASGITPEEAVLLASDLLHEDCAYLFEAFWDLWILAHDQHDQPQWSLQPSRVKFLVHGVEFEEGTYQQEGHVEVDFGIDSPFLRDEIELTSEAETRVRTNVQKLVEFTNKVEKSSGASGRLLWSESEQNFRTETDRPPAESAVNHGQQHSPTQVRPTLRRPSSANKALPKSSLLGSSALDFQLVAGSCLRGREPCRQHAER
jgi:hypothetical protein